MGWERIPITEWKGIQRPGVVILAVYKPTHQFTDHPFPNEEQEILQIRDSYSREAEALSAELGYIQGAPDCKHLLAIFAWQIPNSMREKIARKEKLARLAT